LPMTTFITRISPSPGTCVLCWGSQRCWASSASCPRLACLSWRARIPPRPRTHPDADVSEAVGGWTSDYLLDPHARPILVHTSARVLLVAVLGTQVLATLIAVYGLFMTPSAGVGHCSFGLCRRLVPRERSCEIACISDSRSSQRRCKDTSRSAWIESRNPRALAGLPHADSFDRLGRQTRRLSVGSLPIGEYRRPPSPSSLWLWAAAVAGSIGRPIAPPPFTTRPRRSNLAQSSAP